METQSLAVSLPNIARFTGTDAAGVTSAPVRLDPISDAVADPASQPAATVEQAQKAVASINQVVQVFNRNVEFSVDDDTGIKVVKVVEKDSHDVIRQLPLEAVIGFARTLDTLQGLLVKQEI